MLLPGRERSTASPDDLGSRWHGFGPVSGHVSGQLAVSTGGGSGTGISTTSGGGRAHKALFHSKYRELGPRIDPQLVDESVKGLREVVRGLRPPALEDLGLEVALARLAEDAATDSLEVEFEVLGKAPSRILDDDTELALYRIAQEALSNVARHSGARHGSMTLHFGEDAVELEIVDDGIGFRVSDDFLSAGSTGTGGWGFIGPDGFYHGEHFGMLGMYERAQLVGGNLYVQSAPGRGSTVRAYVPYV